MFSVFGETRSAISIQVLLIGDHFQLAPVVTDIKKR